MGPTTRNSRVIESEAEEEVEDNHEEEQKEVGGELEEDPIVDSDDDDNGVPDAEVVKENEKTTDNEKKENAKPSPAGAGAKPSPASAIGDKRKADEEVLVSPSKLSSKPRLSRETLMARRSVSICIVRPNGITGEQMYGFVVIPRHFKVDEVSTSIMYAKGDSLEKIGFINQIDCAPRVFAVKDIHGNPIQKIFNNRPSNTRCLAFLTESVPTIELIKDHVNNTIAPAYYNRYLKSGYPYEQGWCSRDRMPRLTGENDDMWEVDSWDKVVQKPEDILFIADGKGDLFKWIKDDKTHLYGLFQEGNVPSKWLLGGDEKRTRQKLIYLALYDPIYYLALYDYILRYRHRPQSKSTGEGSFLLEC